MANRKIYGLITEVLTELRALKREDIWREIFNRYGVKEGDIGRRLREHENVECNRCPVNEDGKLKSVWLYSLKSGRA